MKGKPDRGTRLTLFSAAAMTVVIFFMQLIAIDLAAAYAPYWVVLFMLPLTILLSYGVSNLVVDKALNPIRFMLERVREIAKMNFKKPLVVYEESEDVREYATAFNQMATGLNNFIERQKRFISDASHELATPLTVINGHADMLLRRLGRSSADAAGMEESLKIIKAEALRMNELVENLLMLARHDNDKQVYHFAQTDITALLEEILAEAHLIAPEVVFIGQIEGKLTAPCDENAIRRVLRILLSNAVKYGAEITISAVLSHGLIYVTVKDNGPGIAPEHLPHLFERFYRADPSRTQKSGSSGLGLAIAREMITSHGGEIRIESTLGEGASAIFFIKSS